MARAKKDGQYLNVKITADLYRDLMEISEIAGQTKTTVVERASVFTIQRHQPVRSAQ